MSNSKISFRTLDRSQINLAKLHSVDPQLDLEDGTTVASLIDLIEETRSSISDYNTAVANLELTYRTLRDQERTIAQLTERMQYGIAYKYGKNSEQYRLIRTSQSRRRRPPSPAATA